MRNDARPIGEHAPASPIGGDEPPQAERVPGRAEEDRPIPSERPDSRDTVAHGRQSHVINPPADRQPNQPGDPLLPQKDATLPTKI
jgi:hypothetical protein